ncbi:MAG: hypothetical protein EBS90_10035 [Betaproteobacteria bacterium]|nr:hypothetical protein [Betaproteobacteria bacterium]
MENLKERLSGCPNEEILALMVDNYEYQIRQLRQQLILALENGHKWDDDKTPLALLHGCLGRISIAYDCLSYETHEQWANAEKYSGETMWEDWWLLVDAAGTTFEQLELELETNES